MQLSRTLALSVLCGALALGNPFPAQAWGSHFEQVRADAVKGDAKAQTALGNMYHDGFGVEKDIAKALEWYRKAVDQGYGEAQFRLGHEYSTGHGVTADQEMAVKLFKMAAAQGHGAAQFRLAECYLAGLGVQKDSFEALVWYKKSADAGHLNGLLKMADFHYREKEWPQALRYYEKAAEQRSSEAQYVLGLMYLQGQGVDADDKKGARYIMLAATDDKHIAAKAVYGHLLSKGRGVSKNPDLAYEYLSDAAEKDDVEAMFLLAEGLYSGEINLPGSDMVAAYSGGSVDDVLKQEAKDWYEKAAAAGDSRARYRLRERY